MIIAVEPFGAADGASYEFAAVSKQIIATAWTKCGAASKGAAPLGFSVRPAGERYSCP
ncbi:hypothetical protein AB0E01_12370 [Nocardia vinacea]|uniref:hypothetical protein n=1 Tax=Nocardia vinacea TaxID=96468 RepID=UPI0033C56EB3